MDEPWSPGARSSGSRPGWPVDPYRLKRALWRGGRFLIGATLLAAVVGFFLVKVMIGPTYQTTAVLRYEGDVTIAGLQPTTSYSLGPAADALGRQQLLSRIRDEIDFGGSLKGLATAIEYETNLRSQTLSITGSATSAQGASDFVGIIVEVFLEYHRERNARRVEQEIARIATRIEAAEEGVDDARKVFNEFREEHGIADLSAEQESLVESTANLRAKSQLAASEVRALEARVKSLEAQLASVPKTSSVSTGAEAEQATYDQLRQQLIRARASLSNDHPRVQALEQQVEQVRRQLGTASGGPSVFGANATYLAIDADLRAARFQLSTLSERQKGLAEMAERSERRMESFSGLEGDLTALLSQVEVNEALLMQLRGTEAALEDAFEDPPSGFTVLDPGPVPEFPVPSQRKLLFVMLVAISFLIALAVVLWREFRGLRVQTPAEIAFWGYGPVLGTTSWPTDPYGLGELVAALDDFAPDATGTLMLVGGTTSEAPLALGLARRMSADQLTGAPPQSVTPVADPISEPAPLETPPPSGPYPIGGSSSAAAAPSRSAALALRPVKLVRRDPMLDIQAWDGSLEGQALRRAARLADRVLVLVRADTMSALSIHHIRRRLGRDTGIGFLVLDLPEEYQGLPDRVGDVSRFWAT